MATNVSGLFSIFYWLGCRIDVCWLLPFFWEPVAFILGAHFGNCPDSSINSAPHGRNSSQVERRVLVEATEKDRDILGSLWKRNYFTIIVES